MKKIKEKINIESPLKEMVNEIHILKILDVLNAILKKLERIETNTFKGY